MKYQIICALLVIIIVIQQSSIYKVLSPSTYELLEQLQSEMEETDKMQYNLNTNASTQIMDKFVKMSANLTAIELLLIYKGKLVYSSVKKVSVEIYNAITKVQTYFVEIMEILSKDKIVVKTKLINKKYVHNFASLYGGAIILEKSNFMQNVDNVLQDNKDNYLLTDCHEPNQFIIISLKEEIEFQTLMMINQELFASTTKNFQLFGSLIYPVEDWSYLGNYTAQNHNDWQVFQVQPHFVRYVKLEFLSYYQDEYFCILTQIKIFGQTVMADLIQSNKKIIVMPSIDTQSDSKPISQENDYDQQHEQIQDEIQTEVVKMRNSSLMTELIDMYKADEDRLNFNLYTQEEEQLSHNKIYTNSMINRSDLTCSYIDYVRHNTTELSYQLKPKPNQFIEVLPYFSNQSIFKITAQNMLILSHNQDVLKKVVLELQRSFSDFKVNQQQNVKRIYKDLRVLSEIQKDQDQNRKFDALKLRQLVEDSKTQFLIVLAFIALTIIFSSAMLFIVLKKCRIQQQSYDKQISQLQICVPKRKNKFKISVNSQTALIHPNKKLSFQKKKPHSFREIQSVSGSDIESVIEDLTEYAKHQEILRFQTQI